MALDPNEYSVRDLRTELQDVTDTEVIKDALEAERDGQDRATAIDALEGRLNAIRSEAAESDSAASDGGDDPEAADDEEASEDEEESDEGDSDEEDEEESDEGDSDEEDEEESDEGDSEEEDEEDGPERSYPDADSDEQVLYDMGGAGDTGQAGPPYAGHDTIHLPDEDYNPLCGASVGAKGKMAARSELAEDIDECVHCLTV